MSIPFKQLFSLLLGKYQFSQRHSSLQKQSTRVVLWKKCSRNMQQIYRRTSIPEGDFNKATEYMYYQVGHVQININCKKFIIVIWKKKKKVHLPCITSFRIINVANSKFDLKFKEFLCINFKKQNHLLSLFQEQSPEVFYKKAVLKNFVIFKYLRWILFVTKLQAWGGMKEEHRAVMGYEKPNNFLRNIKEVYNTWKLSKYGPEKLRNWTLFT